MKLPLNKSLLLLAALSCVFAFGARALPGSSALQPRATEVVSNDGAYMLRYELVPDRIEVRELFEVRVWVERADGRAAKLELSVDARMPEHGHGMNREPLVTALEDGGFETRNLLFHMPGYWELYFDVTEGALTERAQISLELE